MERLKSLSQPSGLLSESHGVVFILSLWHCCFATLQTLGWVFCCIKINARAKQIKSMLCMVRLGFLHKTFNIKTGTWESARVVFPQNTHAFGVGFVVGRLPPKSKLYLQKNDVLIFHTTYR